LAFGLTPWPIVRPTDAWVAHRARVVCHPTVVRPSPISRSRAAPLAPHCRTRLAPAPADLDVATLRRLSPAICPPPAPPAAAAAAAAAATVTLSVSRYSIWPFQFECDCFLTQKAFWGSGTARHLGSTPPNFGRMLACRTRTARNRRVREARRYVTYM
jgi:hypothetical protein